MDEFNYLHDKLDKIAEKCSYPIDFEYIPKTLERLEKMIVELNERLDNIERRLPPPPMPKPPDCEHL